MSMDRTEIEALLPFLANGSLQGPERDAVEAAVAGDRDLARELVALQAIRHTMQAEAPEASPGELGLARLMREIDQDAPPAPLPQTANDNFVPVARLRIWQAVAAVILAIGIGQVVLTTGSEPLPAPRAETGADAQVPAAPARSFELAAGDAPAPSTAAFRIIFAPNLSELEMRTLLLEARLEIVAGPSAIGFYDLALLDGQDGRATALEVIEAAAAQIEIFEDLQN